MFTPYCDEASPEEDGAGLAVAGCNPGTSDDGVTNCLIQTSMVIALFVVGWVRGHPNKGVSMFCRVHYWCFADCWLISPSFL